MSTYISSQVSPSWKPKVGEIIKGLNGHREYIGRYIKTRRVRSGAVLAFIDTGQRIVGVYEIRPCMQ